MSGFFVCSDDFTVNLQIVSHIFPCKPGFSPRSFSVTSHFFDLSLASSHSHSLSSMPQLLPTIPYVSAFAHTIVVRTCWPGSMTIYGRPTRNLRSTFVPSLIYTETVFKGVQFCNEKLVDAMHHGFFDTEPMARKCLENYVNKEVVRRNEVMSGVPRSKDFQSSYLTIHDLFTPIDRCYLLSFL